MIMLMSPTIADHLYRGYFEGIANTEARRGWQVTWHCSGVNVLSTYAAIVITQDYRCLTPSRG